MQWRVGTDKHYRGIRDNDISATTHSSSGVSNCQVKIGPHVQGLRTATLLSACWYQCHIIYKAESFPGRWMACV